MEKSEAEKLREEFNEQLDRLGASSAATTSAVLALLHILVPELAKHRLLDLDSIDSQLEKLITERSDRHHQNYGALLDNVRDILRTIRATNDAARH